jgi:hypothetical protein
LEAYSASVTCISNIDYTPATKKRQAITNEKQKKAPLPTARIKTTLIDWQATKIGGPPKNHHEDIF